MTNTDTSIQTKIYHTVSCVPKGTVSSYGQIADLAGLPGRARAVGYWLKRTPQNLVLPWHRVLRADGKIAFPPGSETFIEQRNRLIDEGVAVKYNRVELDKFGWKPDLSVLLHQLYY
ncbi:methylated-DNA--[protein]-cysteine S-methyltransferase [Alteromonas sediminis]|uniref:Methylated-DNA--[protein]-cysteine S-methyltransferase n=1 Tax=Alteromonas sediminis TaxID=2259342 RepID=A0A3N5Y7H7_9ALTE|nr:methylated-DNA--[protein]-cysteine S-methyltransferase [Alteromonas sediminis]RPJ66749.1 methylated-DNA--[protein]-cysteine S-methyltransferase [Alteromonas sediminis]